MINIILEVLSKCLEWSVDDIDSRFWKSVANKWWLSIVIDWSTRFPTINRLSSIDHCIPGRIYPSRATDLTTEICKKICNNASCSHHACCRDPLFRLFRIFRKILIQAVALPTWTWYLKTPIIVSKRRSDKWTRKVLLWNHEGKAGLFKALSTNWNCFISSWTLL